LATKRDAAKREAHYWAFETMSYHMQAKNAKNIL